MENELTETRTPDEILKEWLGKRLQRSLAIDEWHRFVLVDLYNSI